MASKSVFKKFLDFFNDLPGVLKVAILGVIVLIIWFITTNVSEVFVNSSDTAQMNEHLSRCGTVIVSGPEELLEFEAVEGCDLVPSSKHPNVEKALDGRDEMELVRALKQAGAEKILVGVDRTDPQLLPPPTLRRLLGTYRTFENFQGIYLSQAAGLFKISRHLNVSDESGEQLVKIARTVLLGEQIPNDDDLTAQVTRDRNPGVQVAVILQGLSPNRQSRRSTNFTRRDFYILREGPSLQKATVSAARRIRKLWKSKGFERREGDLDESLERLTVEVEVLYDKTAISFFRPRSMPFLLYKQHLWNSVELGVHGLSGTYDGSTRHLLPSAAVYRARENVDDYVRRLSRNFDLNEDGNSNDRDAPLYSSEKALKITRFRTHHFREFEPGGEVKRLSRGFLPVGQDAVTEEGVKQASELAASWLVRHLRDDGLFKYKYFPTRDIFYSEFHDDTEEAHNIVRHGLASYSLFMVARELDDEQMWDAAVRSLEPMLENTVIGPEWYSSNSRRQRLPEDRRQQCSEETDCDLPEECIDSYCRLPFGPPVRNEGAHHEISSTGYWESFDGYRRPIDQSMMYIRWKDVGKMGSVAAMVMAMTEMIAEQPDLLDQYRPFLEGYWAFLRFMQKPNGSFNHYFTVSGDARYYNTETTIYPGEILFALSRIYRLLGDEEIKQAYDSGLEYYANWFRREVQLTNDDGTYPEMRRNNLVAFVPWMTMAAADMYEQHQQQEYADIGIEGSVWIAQRYQYDEARTYYPSYLGAYYRIWWEQPAMHGLVYTEGTAAGFALARASGDSENAELLRRSTLLGCRFAVQQIIRPGIDDHSFPGSRARSRARGGVRFSLTVPELRTDYTYHTLSALVQALRYFEGDDWTL